MKLRNRIANTGSLATANTKTACGLLRCGSAAPIQRSAAARSACGPRLTTPAKHRAAMPARTAPPLGRSPGTTLTITPSQPYPGPTTRRCSAMANGRRARFDENSPHAFPFTRYLCSTHHHGRSARASRTLCRHHHQTLQAAGVSQQFVHLTRPRPDIRRFIELLRDAPTCYDVLAIASLSDVNDSRK